MRLPKMALPLTALIAPIALSACADPAPLYVDKAWVQLNPNGQGPASGYFTIHGGGAGDAKLLRVTSEAAQRIEMHESVQQNGMMTMKAIDSVDVPAKSKVEFAPGGKHLMIFNINPAILESGKLTMIMMFSNGDRLIVDAAIQKPGQKAGDATGGKQDIGNAAAGNASGHEGH